MNLTTIFQSVFFRKVAAKAGGVLPKSTMLLCMLGLTTVMSGCGVELRPKVPVFRGSAVIDTPVFIASTASTPGQSGYNSTGEPAEERLDPNDDEAVVTQYQQSGGEVPAAAELVAIGDTIVGRVSEGSPRYYVMNLKAGDSLFFKLYTKLVKRTQSGTGVEFRLIEPDDVPLKKISSYTLEALNWERRVASTAAKQSGRHLIRVSSHEPVDFKLLISGSSPVP